MKLQARHLGFTLVELSIALVIIGLIAGAVMIGRDLIEIAKVRSVVKEHQAFIAAVKTFQGKYRCLPGDCDHATDFWEDASTVAGQTFCGGPSWGSGDPIYPRVCDGDGDGLISWQFPTFGEAEVHGFWEQLALAKLIFGDYSGVRVRVDSPPYAWDNHGWPFTVKGGVNAPDSIMGEITSWSALSTSNTPDTNPRSDTFHPDVIENILTLGDPLNPPTGYMDYPYNPSFSATAALAIDSKLDDGKPGTGRVNAWLGGRAPDCILLNTPDPVGEPDLPVYNTANRGKVCSLLFRDGL
jgi:prepilin-type N-terminal cleavage/methylation domain-containing protein